MTDTDRYLRLAAMTRDRDTDDIEFDEWLWSSLYDHAEGDAPPDPEHIVEIADLWATSPEGFASVSLALVARLNDGRWATRVAWADTTGFGCQAGVDWRINATREAAISQGLDKESRAHLGLSLPGEAA